LQLHRAAKDPELRERFVRKFDSDRDESRFHSTRLKEVRGNQRVQSANPEATYEALDTLRPRSRADGQQASSIPSSAATRRSAASIRILSRKTRTTRC
jgi:hypothetical protein